MKAVIKSLKKSLVHDSSKGGRSGIPAVHSVTFNESLDNGVLSVLENIRTSSSMQGIEIPPIARHLLYCYCFSPVSPERRRDSCIRPSDVQQELRDAWDRLRFEIFYFSLKTKGTFSTHNMSQLRRIHHSFTRFRDLSKRVKEEELPKEMCWKGDCDLVEGCFGNEIDKDKEGFENYTYRTVPCEKVGSSLDQLLQYLWQKRTRKREGLAELLSVDERIGHSRADSDSCQKAMRERLVELCGTGATEQELQLAIDLARHLETVRCLTEVEIAKRPATRHFWLFRNSQPITSISELKHRTETMIRGETWTELDIIAETAEWVLGKRIIDAILHRAQSSQVRIRLIVRSENVPLALGADHYAVVTGTLLKLKEQTRGKLTFRIERLPWWKHNRHLTLLCNNGEPCAGIYFRRRLKTTLIYPVALSDPYDLHILQAIFKRYLDKVKQVAPLKQSAVAGPPIDA
jgi:hypothetical protein